MVKVTGRFSLILLQLKKRKLKLQFSLNLNSNNEYSYPRTLKFEACHFLIYIIFRTFSKHYLQEKKSKRCAALPAKLIWRFTNVKSFLVK